MCSMYVKPINGGWLWQFGLIALQLLPYACLAVYSNISRRDLILRASLLTASLLIISFNKDPN